MSTDAEIVRALLRCVDHPEHAEELARWPVRVVTDLAAHHRLSPLLGSVGGGGGGGVSPWPPDLAEIFRRHHRVTLARNIQLGHALGEVLAAFEAAGIDALVLKGLAYDAILYTRPGSRATSDIDVLAPRQHRRGALETLARLGFAPVATSPGFDEADYHEVELRRGPTFVDLHFRFVPRERCAVDYESVWRRAQPLAVEGQAAARQLAPEHAAAYHALHMAVHHFQVPAIYLVDLRRMLAAGGIAAEAEETARRWRCLRPWRTAMAVTASAHGEAAGAPACSRADEIAARLAHVAPLSRPEQIRRKLTHFDTAGDAARYAFTQGRRRVRELAERLRGRSPEERLGLTR